MGRVWWEWWQTSLCVIGRVHVGASEQSGLSEWPVLGRFVGQGSSRVWLKLLRDGVRGRETVTPKPNKA